MDEDNKKIPEPAIKEQWRELCLVGFIAVLLVFPFLGKRDIWTAGEARVAQVAVQMVRSGDWVVPHIGDALRLEKPPLSYWLVGLTSPFDSNGINEFSSRLPSAIAAVLSALIICVWARKAIGGYGGLLAGIAFVSTSACWWQARNSTIEMTLLFFTVSALYCWWQYNETKSSNWLYLLYLALGFAALDKGPVTPPLILLIIVIYQISLRQNPFKLNWKAHLKGIIIFLLMTLPWAVAVTLRVGKNIDGEYRTLDEWFYQSAGRFEGFDHIKEFWYFLPKVLGDGQPWIFFALIGIIGYLFMGKSETKTKGMRFFIVWVLVTFVFFSIPASKKSYYILPIYPAFAVVAAWVFSNLINRSFSGSRVERACGAVCEFTGSLMVLIGLTLPFMSDYIFDRFEKLTKYGDYISQIMISAAFAILFGIIIAFCATTRRWKIVAGGCFFAAFVSFAIHTSLTEDLNAHKGDRIFCNAIADRVKESDVIYTYAMGGQPIFRYYFDRHVERIISPQYLVFALRDLPDDSRLLLGLDERDWHKFNYYYMLTYDTKKTPFEDIEAVVGGLAARYPKDVSIMANSGRNNIGYVMVSFYPNLPKEHAGKEKWDAWEKEKVKRKSEIYETIHRLNSMGVAARKLTEVFSEFSPVVETGRIWVRFKHSGNSELDKLKLPEKIPYPEDSETLEIPEKDNESEDFMDPDDDIEDMDLPEKEKIVS